MVLPVFLAPLMTMRMLYCTPAPNLRLISASMVRMLRATRSLSRWVIPPAPPLTIPSREPCPAPPIGVDGRPWLPPSLELSFPILLTTHTHSLSLSLSLCATFKHPKSNTIFLPKKHAPRSLKVVMPVELVANLEMLVDDDGVKRAEGEEMGAV
ncbi:MAG: hypothetical protein Q8P67_21810 [archaeon]|nr:hypothetical protein [archaeon]